MAKSVVMAGWDDVPHLTEDDMKEIRDGCEPHLLDARSKGIPSLGSGAIYPINESEFVIDPFPIRPWFRRVYGMDVGWKWTAVVFGALDPETDVLYLYDCHKRSNAETIIHAEAIKRRYPAGQELIGVIDPAARQRGQSDGKQLLKTYRQHGLKIRAADNAVTTGIHHVWMRLSTSRLKVFRGIMSPWLEEYRIYARKEDGRINKINDHCMDATRYLVLSGIKFAKAMQPIKTMKARSRQYF